MENNEPKKKFEWSYLYKVYIVVLIAVFILACANMADAGVIFNNDYYEDPYLEMTDILDNETNYTAFKNGIEHTWGVTLPSWSDTTAIDDFTENVLMYFVGNYANLSATVVGQVSDAISDVTDILDLISFNLETGDFVVTPNREGDLSNVIHGVVDPLIYNEPSGGQIGNWYPLPVTVSISNQSASQRQVFSSDSDVYMCCIGKSGSGDWTKCDLAFAVKGSDTATYTFYGGTSAVNTSYTGTVYSGYYTTRYGQYFHDIGIAPTSWTVYSSLSDALVDFFGTEVHTDPYLNGNGYIINENPTYPPLGIYPSATLDIPQLIVDGHTDTIDPEDPVGFPKGMNTVEPNPTWTDIPTWLVDPSIDFPEEPDYLENVNITQPEFESDNSFLESVYGSLPSGIVLMISISLGLGIAVRIIS